MPIVQRMMHNLNSTLNKLLTQHPLYTVNKSGQSIPLIGDPTVLTASDAGAEILTTSSNFTLTQHPDGLQKEIVVLGCYQGPTQAIVDSIDIGALSLTFRAGQQNNIGAAFPGTFVWSIDTTAIVDAPVAVNFSQTDLTEMGLFVYSVIRNGFRTFSAFQDSSPLWRAIFSNASDDDALGVSLCAVQDDDPTIDEIFLDQASFPGSSELIAEQVIGNTRFRTGFHRNKPNNFEHQWDGGLSGDNATVCYHQAQLT